VEPIDEESGLSVPGPADTVFVRPAHSVPDQPPVRLLLVEDHAGLAEVTAEFLRSAGLEVEFALSGRDALASAVVFQPEIVLCDLNLPDMGGLDVARALRMNPVIRNTLFVIHTGLDDIQVLERHVPAPEVNMILSKPIDEEKVERLLAEARRSRQLRIQQA